MINKLISLIGKEVIVCGGPFSVVGKLVANEFTTDRFGIDNGSKGTARFYAGDVGEIRNGTSGHAVILIKNN